MKANEGKADRAVRVVLGLIAIVAAYMWLGLADGGILGILVGAVMLLTGFVGYCPAYRLIGMSTCKKGCCGSSCETSTN